MRLLFLCHRIPFPPDKGDKIRSWHELEWLAARHEVDLFTLVDDQADSAHERELRAAVRELHLFPLQPVGAGLRVAGALARGASLSAAHFAEPRLKRELDRAIAANRYDLAFAFSSNMAPLLEASDLPRALDFVDVDSAKFEAYARGGARGMKRMMFAIEAPRLRKLERRAAETADLTLVCSEREADALRAFASPRRLEVVGNGTDTRYFAPDPDRTPSSVPRLVFTGAMDYRANVDAVTWFCDSVLPRIASRRPDVRFTIAGSNPTPEVKALAARAGVEVTGRVPDVRPYLRGADVAVAPLRVARGIQNKVLEALACGTPVVATAAAVGGIAHARAGDDGPRLPGCRVADDPERFAAEVLTLLDDPTRARSLGREGREHVVANHRWEQSLARLESMLLDVATSARRTRSEPAAESSRTP